MQRASRHSMADLPELRKFEGIRVGRMRGPDDRPLIDPIVSDAIVKTINNPILLEPVAEAIVDLSIAGWDAIQSLFRSRPPTAKPPPATAATPSPAPQEARQSPPGAQAGPGADEPENGTGAIVGAQSSVPEPLQMVPGRDPAGNEIY